MLAKIELRRANQAVRDPVAWFLPGGDPADWLAEVAAWPIALEQVRFYLVARGGEHDAWAPIGALAVPETKLATSPASGRAQPYGCVGHGRLYLPVDAVLWPPVDDAEIAAAARHAVLVFHPASGLTGFEATDARSAWEFIAPLPRVSEAWDRAVGTLPINDQLRAVRLADPLLPDDLFGEESEDIGRDAANVLPPGPSEPRSVLAKKILLGASGAVAKAILAAAKLVPRTAPVPTWINAVERWASQRLAGGRDQLDRLRHKELHRLLGKLRADPEEGLRHALPLHAFGHRGRATGSTQLGRRNLDFSFGRLGGGQVADFWDVPPDLQRELARSYREAAQRELKLGRHRRAACIFAELLGDLASAADALKQGRHFREAALLYERKLNQPLAGAICLAQGGLLPEAIAIYEKHQRWLDAAELHERLGARDEARAAIRREVEAKRSSGDILAAANLLEARLGEPEVALELLASTWPDGPQALDCLQERFAMLGRLHRWPEVLELVRVLSQQRTPLAAAAGLISMMTKVAETAVAPHVRVAAANLVRVKAAGALKDRALRGADEIAILRALARLAPHDRLLARDTIRFREERHHPPPSGAPRGTGGRIVLQPRGALSLPKVGKWHKVLADLNAAYAVATTPKDNVFFSRVSWRGAVQSVEWPDPATQLGAAFVFAQFEWTIVVARPLGPSLSVQSLPRIDLFGGTPCAVGTPVWLPQDALQAAGTRHTLWVVRAVDARVVLASYTHEQLAWSYDLTGELESAGAGGGGTTLTLEARGKTGVVALGYGQHLFTIENEDVQAHDLGGWVTGILPAPDFADGWVALHGRGAAWVSWRERSVVPLDDTMEFPMGVFLGDGRLVLIGGTVARVWVPTTKGLAACGTFVPPADPIVAITRTDEQDEFALWYENGSAKRWRLP